MNVQETIAGIIEDGADLKLFVRGGPETQITTEGGPIPSLAGLVKRIGDIVAAGLVTVSNTANEIGIGARTFEVAAGKTFQSGQWLTIVNGERAMAGTVVSYTGTSLVVNVTHTLGTGVFNNWTIYISGIPGSAGRDGADGDGSGGTPTPSGPQETLIAKLPWEN